MESWYRRMSTKSHGLGWANPAKQLTELVSTTGCRYKRSIEVVAELPELGLGIFIHTIRT